MGLISAGTTIFDAGAVNGGGAMTFIKKLTANDSSTLSFVDGAASVVLDGTYKEYVFAFTNIHPGTGDSRLNFQGSLDTGSNYNVAITSTNWNCSHEEGGGNGAITYQASGDLAQGTGFHRVGSLGTGGDNDACGGGFLHLYNPADTATVKHWQLRFCEHGAEPRAVDGFAAGYFNTTSAIDAIRFQFDNSSTIGAGTITLYGIS
tara:strand:- start:14 stop:628 length:615 start_codon:yes stop_codon:yes gene_type:complete